MQEKLENVSATDLKSMIEFCKDRLKDYAEANTGTSATYAEPYKSIALQQSQLESILQTKINELCK